MSVFHSFSVEQTEAFAEEFAETLKSGDVVALFGGLGMGKTAFVRGLARGLGVTCAVSSPTFALMHEYGGRVPLWHFDMYRIASLDGLYSTGFFDYLEGGGVLAVEWAENIEAALPESAVRVRLERGGSDCERIITIEERGFTDESAGG